MADIEIQENCDCQSPKHEKHLCHLMYEGFHITNPQEYKDIVQNSQYRCHNCGRTAKNADDLCSPIAL